MTLAKDFLTGCWGARSRHALVERPAVFGAIGDRGFGDVEAARPFASRLRLALKGHETGAAGILELLRVYGAPHGGTIVNEGLARWTYEGRTGYGIAEYLHQLDADGHPVVAVE